MSMNAATEFRRKLLTPVNQLEIALPWPPTVNMYWRHAGNRVLISKEGREYRERVMAIALKRQERMVDGRYAVSISAYPPDRRKRDLDNLGKSVLDSLKHACVYEDDSLIDDLRFRRCQLDTEGRIIVTITLMEVAT